MGGHEPSGPLNVYVFHACVPTDERAGEKWSSLFAVLQGQPTAANLLASASVVDGDVFVFASSGLPHQNKDNMLTARHAVSPQVAARILAGALLVCFLEDGKIDWIPTHLKHRLWAGSEVDIVPGHEPELEPLLRLLRDEPEFKVQLINVGERANSTRILAHARDNSPVAALVGFGKGYVLLLPPMKDRRPRVVREVLARIVPHLLPALIRKPKPLDEPEPEWAGGFAVHGAADLAQDILENRAQLETLQSALEGKETELKRLTSYRGLLWLKGFELQDLAGAALCALGIESKTEEPVDLVHRLADGSKLFIEVEGSDGMVRVDKGSQLLRYIADEKARQLEEGEEPHPVVGAVLGNPFRREPPERRPPAGVDRGFSSQLEALARRERWALIETRQLFDWLTRHLGGDTRARLEAREALGLPDKSQ